jgi:hypothetical protein
MEKMTDKERYHHLLNGRNLLNRASVHLEQGEYDPATINAIRIMANQAGFVLKELEMELWPEEANKEKKDDK